MNEESDATPEFDDVCAATAAAREALCALAHVTGLVEDPREVYNILGDLSAAAISLSRTLGHLGDRDRPTRYTPLLNCSEREGRSAEFQVSAALRRASDFFATARGAIDDAKEGVEQLTYVQDYGLTVRRLHLVDRGGGR